MKRWFHKKVEHLRQQPEDVRLKAATTITLSAGAVLILLWLFIFLPFQLRQSRDEAVPEDEVIGELKNQIDQLSEDVVTDTVPPSDPLLPATTSTPSDYSQYQQVFPTFSPSPSEDPFPDDSLAAPVETSGEASYEEVDDNDTTR